MMCARDVGPRLDYQFIATTRYDTQRLGVDDWSAAITVKALV